MPPRYPGVPGLRQRDLRGLVEFYTARITVRGDDGEAVDLDWYLELNKGSEQRGRWGGYRSQYPKYFRMAVDLEADASTINVYQTEIIHGLLQTEEYMRTLFTEARVRVADQTTEHAIKARLERQQVLTQHDPPEVTFVVSESGLRRRVGNARTMRNQLRRMADLAQLPNVHLHVSPFDCRMVAGVSFPFVLFRVPSASSAAPPLEFAFVETYTAVYDPAGAPDYGVVVARTPQGARLIARTPREDVRSLAHLTDLQRSAVGDAGRVSRDASGAMVWALA